MKKPKLMDIHLKRQTKEHHNPPWGLAKKPCICTYRHNTP